MNNILHFGKQLLIPDSQIQITGNSEVMVDGCKKILEYNDVFVKVRTYNLTVHIWGSQLKVNDYGSDTVFVCGNISSVELEKLR